MYLTKDQNRIVSDIIYDALAEIHALCADGKAEQAGALAEAISELPISMWIDDFDLREFRDLFAVEHQQK